MIIVTVKRLESTVVSQQKKIEELQFEIEELSRKNAQLMAEKLVLREPALSLSALLTDRPQSVVQDGTNSVESESCLTHGSQDADPKKSDILAENTRLQSALVELRENLRIAQAQVEEKTVSLKKAIAERERILAELRDVTQALNLRNQENAKLTEELAACSQSLEVQAAAHRVQLAQLQRRLDEAANPASVAAAVYSIYLFPLSLSFDHEHCRN